MTRDEARRALASKSSHGLEYELRDAADHVAEREPAILAGTLDAAADRMAEHRERLLK